MRGWHRTDPAPPHGCEGGGPPAPRGALDADLLNAAQAQLVEGVAKLREAAAAGEQFARSHRQAVHRRKTRAVRPLGAAIDEIDSWAERTPDHCDTCPLGAWERTLDARKLVLCQRFVRQRAAFLLRRKWAALARAAAASPHGSFERARKRYKVIDGGKSGKNNDRRWMN